MKKRIICLLSFIALILVMFIGFRKVFSFKFGDGILSIEKFYELEDNTVDVLVLGSSHAFENVNPMILWEDIGITAFDMCGSGTPIWNSYFHLKEALNTQKPKLVILEGYTLTFDDEYSDSSRVIKNIYGMKNSKNKLDALRASIPKENFWGFFLEYTQYHNRYKEIWKGDFVPDLNNSPQYKYWLGFADNYVIEPFEKKSIVNDGTKEKLKSKQEEYYRKIIELCNENDIPILTIVVPYEKYSERDAHKYNAARDISLEYGSELVDFNSLIDDIGLDWEEDFADNDHLSYLGNAKFSHYLAKYLESNYDLPHHDIEEEKCYAWFESDKYYVQKIADNQLASISDPDEYISRINSLNDNYTVILKLNGGMDYVYSSEIVNDVLSGWGISEEGNEISGVKLIWVVDDDGVKQCEDTSYDYYWTKRFNGKELLICKKGVYFDRLCYSSDDYGLNILVFNERNEYVVDSVVFDKDGIRR